VKGRLFPEIISKQRKVVGKLDEVLRNECFSGITLTPSLEHVLKGMLNINFHERISPTEVIKVLSRDT